tara:strand:+ start:117 stop:281 length:165 start_codon:yes stop_codon:yes gene_type:complete
MDGREIFQGGYGVAKKFKEDIRVFIAGWGDPVSAPTTSPPPSPPPTYVIKSTLY